MSDPIHTTNNVDLSEPIVCEIGIVQTSAGAVKLEHKEQFISSLPWSVACLDLNTRGGLARRRCDVRYVHNGTLSLLLMMSRKTTENLALFTIFATDSMLLESESESKSDSVNPVMGAK